MTDSVINLLINERLELASQKSEIEEQIKDCEQKIRAYMMKNDMEKIETEHYKVSLRKSNKLVWIDEKAGKDVLAKDGLLSKFMNETFNAAGFKKYLEKNPDYDAGGNLEVVEDFNVSLTAKRA